MRGMGVERGREPDLTQGPGATAPGTPSAPESGDAGGPRGAGAPTVHRARWWYRGPFVRREVRISVGLVLAFLFVFALPGLGLCDSLWVEGRVGAAMLALACAWLQLERRPSCPLGSV